MEQFDGYTQRFPRTWREATGFKEQQLEIEEDGHFGDIVVGIGAALVVVVLLVLVLLGAVR